MTCLHSIPARLLCTAALLACSGPSPHPDQQQPAGDRSGNAPSTPPADELAGPAPTSRKVHVGVAASLRPVLDGLARDYETRHPGITVNVESGASGELCRKAVELHAPYDILVLADASLFAELLQPAWTEHHVLLASDRLVLARSTQARGANRIAPDHLADVLLDDGVRIGMADPDRAPLGYRTLLSMQLLGRREKHAGLADALRTKIGQRFVWPDAAALLAHLQSGELDYAFLYAASALGAKLDFTELPPDANLGSLDHTANYASVSVSVVGLTPGSTLVRKGAPINYGVALAKASENGHAVAFMAEMLGAPGAMSLEAHGLGALSDDPRRVVGRLPEELAAAMNTTATTPTEVEHTP